MYIRFTVRIICQSSTEFTKTQKATDTYNDVIHTKQNSTQDK